MSVLTPYLRFILLLSSHAHLSLSSSLLHVFCVKFFSEYLIFSICVVCPAHLILSVITSVAYQRTDLHAYLCGIYDVREHARVSSKMMYILCSMKIYLLLSKTLLSKVVLGWSHISEAADFVVGSL